MKKRIRLAALGVFLIVVILFLSLPLKVTKYTVESTKLPKAFDGFTVAQISDLHNKSFGKNNRRLLNKLKKHAPDIIVITGDIADSSGSDNAISFVEQAVKIAPTYYVPGNHEARMEDYRELETSIREKGATVLRNETVFLFREGQVIALTGIDDPQFFNASSEPGQSMDMESALIYLADNTVPCQLLLSHRPESFESYCANGYDFVFSGHAHGGQVRLPFIGGLYAPNQGLFPEYDAGIFTQNDTTMVVSKGLGNSVPIPRIGNRPEIVITQLNCEK